VDEQQRGELVAAAQAGDQRALDELVSAYLPLVYNIVGRALDGHLDVDDVVQETMLRAVNALDSLRDPDSFRSWLVAIAMRQVRDRARGQRAVVALDEERDQADPGADFVDLTILRLNLDGQRQEVAEATRWLDEGDRHLLSLWWLEVAGELSRRELADALELPPQHAAVRIQRMKAQLEAARSVVRALRAVPRCYELASLALEWDGRPDSLWRKRLARHTRVCPQCGGTRPDLVPAEKLLVGLALVPLPIGFGAAVVLKALSGGATAMHATAAAHAGTSGFAGFTELVKAGMQLALKPVVAATAGVTLAAGGAVVVYHSSQSHGAGAPVPRAAVASSRSFSPSPSPSSAPVVPSVTPKAGSSSASPSPSTLYGSVVDVADAAPAKNALPGTLPKRPEGTLVSSWGAKAVMNANTDSVTLKGKGYFLVRWQIVYSAGRVGEMGMPTWTGLKGKLFHVASGGSRRMDDVTDTAGSTGMGSTATGYDVLPSGAQQMWQNEYYYVDGEITLHQNEGAADYNLIVMLSSWEAANTDVLAGPPQGAIRYGLVRDTGNDLAPVPQYLTRSTPTDQSNVPQRSRVTP
jgi:RNA polymerase sigma factor (sigma-70 family)